MFNRGGFNRTPFNRPAGRIVRGSAVIGGSLHIEANAEVIEGMRAVLSGSLDIKASPSRIRASQATVGGSLNILATPTRERQGSATLEASLDIKATPTRIVRGSAMLGGSLSIFAAPTIGRSQTAELELTLLPGDIVVIDSCQYTVTHNGINAFESYNGDWIFLEEDSQKIELSSKTGGTAEIKVNVVPRWL